MRLWHILGSRVRSLVLRDRREAELNEELQLHIDRETERLRSSGMAPEVARDQALRAFAAVEQIQEVCRDARGKAINTVKQFRRHGHSKNPHKRNNRCKD